MKRAMSLLSASLLMLTGCTQEPKDSFYTFLATYEGMQFCNELKNWDSVNADELEGSYKEFEAAHPEGNEPAEYAIWGRFEFNAEKASNLLAVLSSVPESPLKQNAVDEMQYQVDLAGRTSDVSNYLDLDGYDYIEGQARALSSYRPHAIGFMSVLVACQTLDSSK